MPETLINGFRFSLWPDGKQLLIVESDRLDECIAYCRKERIEWLHISPYHGYYLDNLDFLRKCRHVLGIHMQQGFSNYRGLYHLPHLASLSAVFPHNIDLSALRTLADLSTESNPVIDDALFPLKSLNRLWLRGYKPKSKNLLSMQALPNLKDLTLIRSPIRSLRGIEALTHLRRLELSYCQRLYDTSSFADLANTLEELEIDHCRKIRDLTSIRALKRLRKAILADTRSVPSLAFIQEMPRLEFLSFVRVNVVDGDMTPCFRLKHCDFLKKRRYSHTPGEVAKIISGKTRVRAGSRNAKVPVS